MFCEIARKVEAERIQSLEKELGLTLVAFSCRALDPAREERLQKIMEELSPRLLAPQAGRGAAGALHELEADSGLTLIAVEAAPS